MRGKFTVKRISDLNPRLAVFFLLALVLLAVYGQVIQHELISLDDRAYI